jgi:hypothetical protein
MHNKKFDLRGYYGMRNDNEDVFEHQTLICEVQSHIVYKYNKDEEDYDKDNDKKEATQFEEYEQPSEANMKVDCTNEMVRKNFKMKINLNIYNVYYIIYVENIISTVYSMKK